MRLSTLEKIRDSGLLETEKKILDRVIDFHIQRNVLDESAEDEVKSVLKAQRQRRKILNEIAVKIKRKCEYENMGWKWLFLKLNVLIRPDAKELAEKIKAQESVTESDQKIAAKIMKETAKIVTERFKRKEAEDENEGDLDGDS